MKRKPAEFISELKDALTKHQNQKVNELIDSEDFCDFDEGKSEEVIKLLRGKRKHEKLEQASSAILDYFPENNNIRIHRTQSLIELGKLPQATSILSLLEKSDSLSIRHKSEVTGLTGRIHKQRFVADGSIDDLKQSINAYQTGWSRKEDDYRWHGVNLVALLHRAQEEKIKLNIPANKNEVAQKIITEIEKISNRNQLESWDCATAFECSLAIGDSKQRDQWLAKYLKHPNTDAFELNSTLRQLREIWNIEKTPDGEEIIPLFEHAILDRTGGELIVFDTSVDNSSKTVFEAVYGDEGPVKLSWLQGLLRKLDSVARVLDIDTEQPIGSGFLIEGKFISDKYNEQVLFVTNSHVVSDSADDEAPLRVDDAVAEFTTLEDRPKVKLGKCVFYSTKTKLDISVHEIDQPNGSMALSPKIHLPKVPSSGEPPMRIYVIGHPEGGEISITLFGNELKGIELPYFHYKSPSLGGSSGSPVFNRSLKLVGLHHASRSDLDCNQGVAFKSISESLK
ncbi:TRAFs-binding domain-containing protein [Marinicella sp. W31]|uniref:TRAFs-binding domain-containing protein n=1 Tax=Marinicella sp. W31 TaxID=3023713 RepID=UPI00375695CC